MRHTAVDITPALVERAATELMACEAEQKLTDVYGRAHRDRARLVAKRMLTAALDLRRED